MEELSVRSSARYFLRQITKTSVHLREEPAEPAPVYRGFLPALPPSPRQPLSRPAATFARGEKAAAPLLRRAPAVRGGGRRSPAALRDSLPGENYLLLGWGFFCFVVCLCCWVFFRVQVAVLPPSMLNSERCKSGSLRPLRDPAPFISRERRRLSTPGRRASIAGGKVEPWAAGCWHLGDRCCCNPSASSGRRTQR